MMPPIKFSVIIPAYNAASTIAASIASCLTQTFPPHEIIVVNDGSTDNTRVLLEAHSSENIRLIHLALNSGPAAARNAGLRIATGTYIAFQDADDIWHREKLEHIAAVLHQYADIAFLFHPYTLSAVNFTVNPSMLQPVHYPLWKLLLSNPIGTPCVVMRRSPGIRFDERLRYMEDYELFLREAYLHGVYRIAAPFTQVGRPILSAGGQSSHRWKMRQGEICAWWAFAKERPFFMLVLLPLIVFALAKHVIKAFFPPRTNY